MTALTRYQRLEGEGLWRPDAQTQRRNVAVRLGESSLVIVEARSNVVLSHWALSAVLRENPGRKPALFVPGADAGGESLETDDEVLIDAIETIHAALTPPQPGRWLRWGAVAVAVVLTLAGALVLPQILTTRTVQIVPQAMRAQIGREALDELIRAGNPVRLCAEPSGRQALTALRNRVLGPNWRVQVVDGLAGFESGHLPGQIIVLSRDLVERLDSPEALAGWLVAEELAATARDPMLDVLRHTGTRATLTLLSTGNLPDRVLTGYAAARLTRPPVLPEAAALVQRLHGMGASASPYADSLPPAAARLAAILSTDETRGAIPLLSDGEWLTLQSVCQE
jgi:hypothetical protein